MPCSIQKLSYQSNAEYGKCRACSGPRAPLDVGYLGSDCAAGTILLRSYLRGDITVPQHCIKMPWDVHHLYGLGSREKSCIACYIHWHRFFTVPSDDYRSDRCCRHGWRRTVAEDAERGEVRRGTAYDMSNCHTSSLIGFAPVSCRVGLPRPRTIENDCAYMLTRSHGCHQSCRMAQTACQSL